MTTPRRRGAAITDLIEASSLGSPRARAVRLTVKPAVAASLVARSAARGQMHVSSKKKPKA
jgi:hypothetical protein